MTVALIGIVIGIVAVLFLGRFLIAIYAECPLGSRAKVAVASPAVTLSEAEWTPEPQVGARASALAQAMYENYRSLTPESGPAIGRVPWERLTQRERTYWITAADLALLELSCQEANASAIEQGV